MKKLDEARMAELMILRRKCSPRLSLDDVLQLPENKMLVSPNEVQPLPSLNRDAKRSEHRVIDKAAAARSKATADARQPESSFLLVALLPILRNMQAPAREDELGCAQCADIYQRLCFQLANINPFLA
jgi:hypothetical protein